jgi:hypothetical protein
MKRILLSALLLSGLMLAVAQVKKEDLATKNTKSPGAETSVTVEPSQQVGIKAHGDDFFRCGRVAHSSLVLA